MNILKFLAIFLLSFNLFANTAELDEKVVRVELQDQISQLSNEQQKQLLNKLQTGETDYDLWEDRIDSLSKLGTGIGTALNSTVKELGVTVNDFSHTYVGMLTISVILWHYIGDDIWDVFVGVLVLLIGTYISKKSFNNLFCIRQEDGSFRFNRGTLMAGNRLTESKDYDGGEYGFWWAAWIVLNVVMIGTGITLIA